MTLDTRLLELLVCPVCKGPLKAIRRHDALAALGCRPDHLAFPITDGIPVLIEAQAHAWDEDEDIVDGLDTPSPPPTTSAST
jgi:uncharacterized protein